MPLDQLTRTTTKRIKIPALTKAEVDLTQGASTELIRITRPRIRQAVINIRNMPDSPYVQHAFSEKQRKAMEETQRAGQQARGKRNRAPKEFELIYEAAKHKSKQGWLGIPAGAFRNASIDVCRMVGIKMTFSKLSIFIVADGRDAADGTPLVRIQGEPHISELPVRNASGVADIRWRPMWDEWSAAVRVEWDEDQLSAKDVYNLFSRAGWHVGIGEGRPNSPNSNGMGWGRFELVE